MNVRKDNYVRNMKQRITVKFLFVNKILAKRKYFFFNATQTRYTKNNCF